MTPHSFPRMLVLLEASRSRPGDIPASFVALLDRARRRVSLPLDLVAIAVLPLVLIPINDSWMFPVPGQIDPYVYTGHFLDLEKYLNTFENTYYGSRLPWLLLGSIAYSLFSAEEANLVLRLLLFYGATVSIYVIVRALFKDRLAATLTAVLLGVNTHFLASIGWDYVDGPAIVTMLVMMALLSASLGARLWAPALLLGAGAALTTTLSNQLFLIAIVPGILGWYVLLNLWTYRSIRGTAAVLVARVPWLVLGSFLALVFYGLVNEKVDGDFNYLQPQIDMIGRINEDQYRVPYDLWLRRAQWLVLPAIGVMTSVALLGNLALRYWKDARSLTDKDGFAAIAALLFLSVALVMAYLELARAPVLQLYYYASYLIPFAAVAVGAALTLALSRARFRWAVIVVAACVAALVLPLAVESLRPLPSCYRCSFISERGLVVLAAALLLGAGLLARMPLLVLPAVAALSFLNIGSPSSGYDVNDTGRRHEQFLLTIEANSALDRFDEDGRLLFWYDRRERMSGLYTAVSSLHLWGYRLVSTDFPGWTNTLGQPSPLRPGQVVAILSTKDDTMALANSRLAEVGQEAELLQRIPVRGSRDSFDMYVIRTGRNDFLTSMQIPPAKITPTITGQVERQADGSVLVRTEGRSWSYASLLKLPVEIPPEFASNPVIISFQLTAERGKSGIGILKNDRSLFLVYERLQANKDKVVEVRLTLDQASDASDVIIFDWEDSTSPATIRVHDIKVEIYKGKSPTLE